MQFYNNKKWFLQQKLNDNMGTWLFIYFRKIKLYEKELQNDGICNFITNFYIKKLQYWFKKLWQNIVIFTTKTKITVYTSNYFNDKKVVMSLSKQFPETQLIFNSFIKSVQNESKIFWTFWRSSGFRGSRFLLENMRKPKQIV